LVKVERGLVLLVLVQIDRGGGDDGRKAERDRDDDLQPALPGAGGSAGGGSTGVRLGLGGAACDPGLLQSAADSSGIERRARCAAALE
jgi:hypothetical protein